MSGRVLPMEILQYVSNDNSCDSECRKRVELFPFLMILAIAC